VIVELVGAAVVGVVGLSIVVFDLLRANAEVLRGSDGAASPAAPKPVALRQGPTS